MKGLVRNVTAVWVVSLGIFAGAITAGAHDQAVSSAKAAAQRREVRIPIGNFSLTDQDGRQFHLQMVKGKIILIAFAYTTCPDVCPLITAAMRQVQKELQPSERAAIHLLTITTDPEVDDPKVLSAYARRYGVDFSNWSFLTGSAPALKEVWQSFGVKVQRKARGLVDHTALTAVIDGAGAMRFAYFGAAPDAKIILDDIRRLRGRR